MSKSETGEVERAFQTEGTTGTKTRDPTRTQREHPGAL